MGDTASSRLEESPSAGSMNTKERRGCWARPGRRPTTTTSPDPPPPKEPNRGEKTDAAPREAAAASTGKWRHVSEQGDAAAQHNLGACYAAGDLALVGTSALRSTPAPSTLSKDARRWPRSSSCRRTKVGTRTKRSTSVFSTRSKGRRRRPRSCGGGRGEEASLVCV